MENAIFWLLGLVFHALVFGVWFAIARKGRACEAAIRKPAAVDQADDELITFDELLERAVRAELDDGADVKGAIKGGRVTIDVSRDGAGSIETYYLDDKRPILRIWNVSCILTTWHFPAIGARFEFLGRAAERGMA